MLLSIAKLKVLRVHSGSYGSCQFNNRRKPEEDHRNVLLGRIYWRSRQQANLSLSISSLLSITAFLGNALILVALHP